MRPFDVARFARLALLAVVMLTGCGKSDAVEFDRNAYVTYCGDKPLGARVTTTLPTDDGGTVTIDWPLDPSPRVGVKRCKT